ncbi:TcpQ domain-containing protein [Colwellia sp. E2M01]|uniref:TcpQ domain-containing protein n=1 Tax=Colwellia sp. E2M01 TaxID=2841561 RepID=UPI001C08B53B|nr:TcpQ domain-containing protein [Colwellia sp. E2M01]MBU2869674.1 toxin co-regulated pilus biosynthesis Q family protein [Colwellia sp. E2M01]
MGFWLRNLILGLFLAILAWGFISNKDLLLSLAGSLESEDNAQAQIIDETPATIATAQKTTTVNKPQQSIGSSNAAAIGLSKFYANLHGDMDGKGPKIRNNIVYLSDPQGNLVELLQARERIVRPYRKNWQGSVESRPFRPGETLNQKLAEYTEAQGVELIWWLNRDYVVKDSFRIEQDLLKTSFQVAKAVAGHFPSGLSTFFCYKQRAIVVIESEPHDFLDNECTLLQSNQSY